jgi:hypothetical protein
MKAKALGGVARAIDAPVTLSQNALDVIPLDGFEGLVRRCTVNPRTRNLRQREEFARRQDHGAFDDVPELPNVARTRSPATQT